jgi:hypothetical protein
MLNLPRIVIINSTDRNPDLYMVGSPILPAEMVIAISTRRDPEIPIAISILAYLCQGIRRVGVYRLPHKHTNLCANGLTKNMSNSNLAIE